MPSVECVCGYRIGYGTIPCDDEYLFIADTSYDEFSGEVDAEKLYAAMRSFLKCPECGRLWVFWKGYGVPATEYVPPETTR